MKKLVRLWPAGAALLLLGGLLLSPSPAGEEAAPAGEEAPYILKEYQGCVAIYCDRSSGEPQEVTDIEVRLLPAWDRALLSRGLGAGSRRELNALLEDLGS